MLKYNSKVRKSRTDNQRKYYIFSHCNRFLMRECMRITGIEDVPIPVFSRLDRQYDEMFKL